MLGDSRVATFASKAAQLRALLRDERPLVLPGVFNGISALAAEAAGARAVYISGAGAAPGARQTWFLLR